MYRTPDLAIVNGRVWTGDPARPWATALLARGPELVLVGSTAEVRKLAKPGARIIDVRGAMVAPGFVESAAAYADFAEHPRGVLRTGTLADFVVVDRDLTQTAPGHHVHTRVLLTVVDGRIIFDSGELT